MTESEADWPKPDISREILFSIFQHLLDRAEEQITENTHFLIELDKDQIYF